MAKILNKAKQNRAEECVKCARHCVEIEASDGDIREKGPGENWQTETDKNTYKYNSQETAE